MAVSQTPRPGMLRRVYRYSPLGFILSCVHFLISFLWVIIAFDNPWHQGILIMLSFPASFIVLPLYDLMAWFPHSSEYGQILTVASDACFIVVGTAWYFMLGASIQKGIPALYRTLKRRRG
jgi:hypothetical protein